MVDDKDLEGAQEILKELGYRFDPEESKNNVKVYLHSNPWHMVELHTRLWEDFKGPIVDRLESLELVNNPIYITACKMDVWTLNYENHLIYQLFHIIKHFSLEGIGARSLLDITLFVNRHIDEIDVNSFWHRIEVLGYTRFVEVFFSLCIEKLEMNDQIMKDHVIASSDLVNELELDLLKVGSAVDREARWQIMGAMEAYFTGETKVPHSKLKRRLSMMFPSADALPKVYTYARKYPVLLPAAWIHRGVKFAIQKQLHKEEFFGINEKINVGERRLNLMDELGLNNETE